MDPSCGPEVASAMLALATPVASGQHRRLEVRLRHADGDIPMVRDAHARDMSDDAEIAGSGGRTLERSPIARQRRELLATSEARFRALVQNSSDVVAVVDLDGRFCFVSPASHQRARPHLAQDLVGTPAVDLLPHDELARLQLTHAVFLDRGLHDHPVSPPSMEVQLQGREGEWHTVDITVTDLRHEPAVGGIVLNARDVTVRKALEHDLRHQALHDALTGLANRAMFTERVDRDVADRG